MANLYRRAVLVLLFLLIGILSTQIITAFNLIGQKSLLRVHNSNRCIGMVHKSFEEYFNRPGAWDDRDLGPLLDANKRWIRRLAVEQPDYFLDQKRGHAPKILWIGCADARVPANEIIGEPAGSVFVHRNIANMVVNTDFNCMSVLQVKFSSHEIDNCNLTS